MHTSAIGFLWPVDTPTPRVLVRFTYVPQIGQRIKFNRVTWVVSAVHWGLPSSTRDATITPEVQFEPVGTHQHRQVEADVVVRLYDEGSTDWEGELVRFPALPTVGEVFHELHEFVVARKVVKAVGQAWIKDESNGTVTVETQVLVGGIDRPRARDKVRVALAPAKTPATS